jgi:hypothetical protein
MIFSSITFSSLSCHLQLQHERHLPAIMMPDRNRQLYWGSLCVRVCVCVCVLCRRQPFGQQWHTASERAVTVFRLIDFGVIKKRGFSC